MCRHIPTYHREGESSFLIAHLSLIPVPESGAHSSTQTKQLNPMSQLYGSLVSSPQTFRDLHGRQGTYFLFPDVSIRIRGRFRLGVTLIELPGSVPELASNIGSQLGILDQVCCQRRPIPPSSTPRWQRFDRIHSTSSLVKNTSHHVRK
jgi:hypothetical protein